MVTQSSLIWPLLKLGSTGADVRAAQYLLTCRGCATDATGTFDQPTAHATSDFQAKVGIEPQTGEIDEDTWDFLTNNDSTVGMNTRPKKPNCVKAAQIELRKQKARPLVDVTGDFDQDTEDAAKDFQRRVGGDQDGIVGPATWKNLVCRKPPSS